MLDKTPRNSNATLISHIDTSGSSQVWSKVQLCTSGTCVRHRARRSLMSPIRVSQRFYRGFRYQRAGTPIKCGYPATSWSSTRERFGKNQPGDVGGGVDIYDVSKPAAPRLITQWRTKGGGVHRFDFDGRYAYISPTVEGFVGNIVMILDLADPANPTEDGALWWIPGQWTAGGEPYPWDNWPSPRCRRPLPSRKSPLRELLASRVLHS